MELTIKELAAYYGYNLLLKDITNDAICNLKVLHKDCVEVEYYNNVGHYELNFEDFKPILYPLDYLTKEITHNGEKFVPIERIFNMSGHFEVGLEWFKQNNIECLPHFIFEKLIAWRFDIFSLIENNLAIAVTEDFNPYK